MAARHGAGSSTDAFAVRSAEAVSSRAAPPGTSEAIFASISSSYFRLRRGLAYITLAFPPMLWLGAGGHRLQGSISAYYHFAPGGVGYGGGTMRDVFVGVLWTVGAILFFYKGYSRAENVALNLAGVASVLIALFPADWPEGSAITLSGRIHGTSAAVFFAAIAYVCLWCSGDTLQLLNDTRRRRWFKRIYALLGTLMIGVPATAFLVRELGGRGPGVVLWLIEVSAIYVFSTFWLVKSYEIALIERQPPR